MAGRLVLQSVVMLCLVLAANAGGYSAAYGVSTEHRPQPNGIGPQNGGGVGALLMPSKGVGWTAGQQNGYAGYLTKGRGYGAATSTSKGVGIKGYGVKAGPTNRRKINDFGAQAGGYGGLRTKGQNAAVFPNGNGARFNGYGVVAGQTNEQQMKGYGAPAAGYGGQVNKGYGVKAGLTNGQQTRGYGVQAGGYGGLTKGNGYGAQAGGHGGQRTKGNGYGVISGPTSGQQTKGYGAQAGGYGGQRGNSAAAQNSYGTKGVVAGPSGGHGARANGQGGDGRKPMKGYGRPLSGMGRLMGPFRGLGEPQSARSQEKGYRGGYGAAGLGLGSRLGHVGMKGPVQGYGAAAGVSNGQGVRANGYSGVRTPNGNGAVQTGYGNPRVGAAKAAKPGFTNHPNGYGAKPNGYEAFKGSAVRSESGYLNGAAPNGYGSKPKGHRVGNGAALGGYGGQPNGYGLSSGSKPQMTKGVGALSSSEGYGMGNGKGQAVRGADLSDEKSLKGGVFSPRHPDVPQQALTQGGVLSAPANRDPFMVTEEKYQKLLAPQDKSYKQKPLLLEATPEAAPALPDPHMALQNSPAPEPVLPQEGGLSVSKSQGGKQAKPGYFAGGHNGYGAGFMGPYGGEMIQPGYGRGVYLRHGNGDLFRGSVSSYGVGGQSDHTALGAPPADGLPGGTKPLPFSGASTGFDGRRGLPFGGQTPRMSSEKLNTKFGVGGLQFGEQAVSPGVNGARRFGYGVQPFGPAGEGKPSGKYGGLGVAVRGDPGAGIYGYGGFPNGGQHLSLGSNGNKLQKYGYGKYPHEAQPAGLTPEAESAGQYSLTGSLYQPEPVGLQHSRKPTGKYGSAPVPYGPQTHGFGGEAKPWKYDKQAFQPQSIGSAVEGAAGFIYEPRPLEPNSAGKSYVKGEVPTAALAGEGDRMSVNRYENVGYINGQVQPNVVSFSAAPTSGPTLAFSPARVDSLTPDDVSREDVQDFTDDGVGSHLESAPAAERHSDDLELPRQIHIQQHLKLHFHPQGGKKYDLNGFFGNDDHQG
ncbi:calymmin isoform X2 [Kryptolebias marmoratus]|uniref:calymmin isoform X2 n=1 Tax=Kryptolebias marmoratus TaxID=37003 RepID=UPI0018AC8E37|nr:calymmin isoform X2 [Kryptolebias marmoratus]